MRLLLAIPPGFSYERTVYGHGWASLPPFRHDLASRTLRTTLVLPRGCAVGVRLVRQRRGVLFEAPGRSSGFVRQAARRMLNLDADFSEFHAEVARYPEFSWIARAGAGRLLRSPTLFEDLVKLILTTNCNWAFTTKMAHALVDLYGEPAADGTRAFPTPQALAGAGEKGLRRRVRAGYRAPLLARLSRMVADGEIDPEAWEGDERDPSELRRDLLELPGVGPYVAENMLRLLGRPDGLGLDSWLRAVYARIHHGGAKVTDRTIVRRYARFGRWAGLALFCEMTRDWFDGDEPVGFWEDRG